MIGAIIPAAVVGDLVVGATVLMTDVGGPIIGDAVPTTFLGGSVLELPFRLSMLIIWSPVTPFGSHWRFGCWSHYFDCRFQCPVNGPPALMTLVAEALILVICLKNFTHHTKH